MSRVHYSPVCFVPKVFQNLARNLALSKYAKLTLAVSVLLLKDLRASLGLESKDANPLGAPTERLLG